VTVYVLHDLAALDIKPQAHGIRVVVYGHSHKASVAERDGVLYVNPGSAGPRRFRLPITAAELLVDGGRVTANIRELTTG
jgi:predicted phosphodiesterase